MLAPVAYPKVAVSLAYDARIPGAAAQAEFVEIGLVYVLVM